MVAWDDAYTFSEIESVMPAGQLYRQVEFHAGELFPLVGFIVTNCGICWI